MSGIVVSPLLKGLLRKLNSLQVDERTTSISNGLKGQVRDIIATLETIAESADDAEQLTIRDERVQNWLQRLQNLLYAVDDAIDMVQIMNCSNSNDQSPPAESADLEDQVEFLSLETLVDKRPADVYKHRVFEDDFFLDPLEIIGRRGDEKAVINLILKSDQRVAVVPIVGFIGIGKTRLAQLIYCNKRVHENFDRKLWLWVGDCRDNFEFWTMLSDQFFGNDPLKEDGGDIKQMKVELQKLLANKRILIVLDDFKDNNSHKSVAIELIDVLSNNKGSAIVVTTRSRRAASLIGTTPPYQLQPLSPDASYELLARESFPLGRKVDPEYQRAAREFVNFCGGIPLLLKRIRPLLNDMDIDIRMGWRRYLEDVRHHGFANIKEVLSLYDAFLEFPSHLKLPLQCFRLQKACGLGVEALICIWMAFGFLFSDDDTIQPPEYIARKYLKQFVESAFCPDVQCAPGGVVRQINFNDALYVFATATDPSWVTVSEVREFYGSPVYMIWNEDCLRGTFGVHDCIIRDPDIVRLFMVSTGRRASLQFVRDIVSCFPHLRVLGVGGYDGEMLPDSIGELKHLRYLDVGRSPRMISLPDSISNLWHLQTLFLQGCSQLQELQENIGRLQNLRYLTLTILMESLPEAIGQLTSLRTFGLSSCPRLASLPSTIKNLKKLETLAIVKCPELDLESTSSVEGFKGLDSIHTLLLSHLPKFASLPELGSPSVALKHLQILFCTRLTETKWITQFRSLRSLTIEVCPQLLNLRLTDEASQLDGLLELVVRRCPILDSTAWIRQFVSLRSLVIDACPKLVDLDAAFSELKNLERLEIRRCPGLTKWFASPAGKDWRQIAHVRAFVGMFLLP